MPGPENSVFSPRSALLASQIPGLTSPPDWVLLAGARGAALKQPRGVGGVMPWILTGPSA